MKAPSKLSKDQLLNLSKCRRLQDIIELDLTDREVESLDTEVFNQLTSLRSLYLSCNNLKTIPDDLRLDRLEVLDLTDNDLHSIEEVKNFPNLRQLFINRNTGISVDDSYLATALCPQLSSIDGGENLECFHSGVKSYESQLTGQVTAVWEARFADVYADGVSEQEIDSLQTEFVNTIEKSGIVGMNLSMVKLRRFMINRLARQLICDINTGVGKKGTKRARCPPVPAAGTPTKYSTRTSSGTKRTMDYSSGTPVEKEPVETPTRKRKRSPLSPDTPTATYSVSKKRRETTPKCPGSSSKKSKKNTPKKTPSGKGKTKVDTSPNFTKLNDRLQTEEQVVLGELDDYDPALFLRCHSEDNDPQDDITKVWKCAFEPKIGGKPGETSTTLATCGGNIVCFIDCQTGKVMRRYKDSSKTESFYALAWTTLKTKSKDINILAVAGQDGQIKLIHPTQLVMFGVIGSHRCYVNCLLFNPQQPNILYSSSMDNKVVVWDVGIPDFKDCTISTVKKATMCLSKTDAVSLVYSPTLDVLVAGCDDSCYAWCMKNIDVNTTSPHYEFVHPTEDSDADSSSEIIDGLVLLSNNCVVSKCVGHSCLYLWDLRQHVVKRANGIQRVPVKPLALLEYAPTTVDYIYPSVMRDLVMVGDDKGRVHMYDLTQVVKKKKPSDEVLAPTQILEYPDTKLDTSSAQKMKDVITTQDGVVVNCVAMSSDRQFLVYGTDNNLVCVWNNASKL